MVAYVTVDRYMMGCLVLLKLLLLPDICTKKANISFRASETLMVTFSHPHFRISQDEIRDFVLCI